MDRRDTMLGVRSDRAPMPREVIRGSERQKPDCWVSPNYGDGGWHTTPGCELYTTEWQPLRDRILVEFLPEGAFQSWHVVFPEIGRMRLAGQQLARILKIGPGKWVEGVNGGVVRRRLEVKPGMLVWIGPYVDWQSVNGLYAICQEADVRVVVNE